MFFEAYLGVVMITIARLKVFGNKLKQQKILLLFLTPAILSVIIFSYIPMAGIVMAFQEFSLKHGFLTSPWVGLMHFKEFIHSPDFLRALRNTIAINGFSILLGFPAPIIFAILINELANLKIKKVFQTVTYFPHFVSWVVVAGLFYRILDPSTGLVNFFLGKLGIGNIEFLRNPDYFWAIIVFAAIWKELGWNSVIYIANISGIDPTLYEASMVDGANRFQRIVHITLPSISPTAILLLILTAGSIVSVNFSVLGTMTPNFEALFNFSNPLVMSKSDVVDIYAYRTGIAMGDYSYAAAIGFTVSFLSFVFVFLANNISRKINGYSIF